MQALAGATGLSELRYLDLRKTPMSVAAAATLAGSTALRALEEIDLGVNAPVRAQTVEAPPHRLVGQGPVGRTDPGVDRVDARYG